MLRKTELKKVIVGILLTAFAVFMPAMCTFAVEKDTVIVVKSVAELMATEQTTKKGHVTVLIEDGTYTLPKGLWLTGDHITYKGKSGKSDKVVLKGGFKASHIFWITNDDVTLQDMSIGQVNNHAVQIHSEKDADRAVIRNVRFFDTKEQMLKGSASKEAVYSDDCVVENCTFEFTEGKAYQSYTGGIDVHKGRGWIVRNNTFKNIQYPKGGLTEGAIHFWDDSSKTRIENNSILGCDRGIMLGLDNSFHDQGWVEENSIQVTRDVGIYLCNATKTVVRNNAITCTSAYPNAIEYRFKTDGTRISGNVVNRQITSRNGGVAVVSDNTILGNQTTSSAPATVSGQATIGAQATTVGSGIKRVFPDTTSKTLCFSDQLTVKTDVSTLTEAQLKFMATQYAGTQKITKSVSKKIRAYNPGFLVLHYRLGIWQSVVPYILDGEHWSNDYGTVNTHEDWFMHAPRKGVKSRTTRIAADTDGKLLMDISNSAYVEYFKNSTLSQMKAGDYDGVFLDSSAPSSLQYDLGKKYPEYAGTGAAKFYTAMYEKFMRGVSKSFGDMGYMTLPNIGQAITGWDPTDYSVTSGAFAEGALDWQKKYPESDWKLGMNNLLKLVNQDKILICQTYLERADDYKWRTHIIANYLLLRGKHTYINYFADKPFEYYPEYDLELGAPLKSARVNIDELKVGNVYVRPFEKGLVIVNSSDRQRAQYVLPEKSAYQKVQLVGGGTVKQDGSLEGRCVLENVEGSLTLEPKTAWILIKK